jgi:hypothetical protein
MPRIAGGRAGESTIGAPAERRESWVARPKHSLGYSISSEARNRPGPCGQDTDCRAAPACKKSR